MNINYELIQGIILSIVVFTCVICFIIAITLMMFSKLTPDSICQDICEQKNGTYNIATDCKRDILACSGFCESNNTIIYCEDILNNITVAV